MRGRGFTRGINIFSSKYFGTSVFQMRAQTATRFLKSSTINRSFSTLDSNMLSAQYDMNLTLLSNSLLNTRLSQNIEMEISENETCCDPELLPSENPIVAGRPCSIGRICIKSCVQVQCPRDDG